VVVPRENRDRKERQSGAVFCPLTDLDWSLEQRRRKEGCVYTRAVVRHEVTADDSRNRIRRSNNQS
jgi:hypothetical protein